MNDSTKSLSPEGVERVIRDVVGTLVPNTVAIDVDRFSRSDMTSFWLKPVRRTAATLTLAVDDSGDRVYMILGRTTYLEIDFRGGTLTKAEAIEEIRLVCQAIVDGRFRERVWTRNGEIVRALGILNLEGQAETRISYCKPWSFLIPFGARDNQDYLYTPYAPS